MAAPAEHVMHAHPHRRHVAGVVDGHVAPARRRQRRRDEVGERDRLVPRELRAEQHGHVEGRQVGGSGGPDEVRREPLVERAEQGAVGPVRPRIGLQSAGERHPGAQRIG